MFLSVFPQAQNKSSKDIAVDANEKIKLDDSFVHYRNTFYVESFGSTGFGVSINYRRTFPIGHKKSLDLSGGFGALLISWSEESDFVIPLSFTFVYGEMNALEVGVGYSYLVKEKISAPNIVVGYRLQSKSFFFWAGFVNLIFIDSDGSAPTSWPIIPAPGIRFGKSF